MIFFLPRGSAVGKCINKKSVEPCPTLILQLGSLQNLTPKKNDKAHAEYVHNTQYTMAHYQLAPVAKTMMHGGILHIP